jgi:hypothetical protein
MHFSRRKSHKAVTTPIQTAPLNIKCLLHPSQLRRLLPRFLMPPPFRHQQPLPTMLPRRLWRPLPLLPSMLVNWIPPLLRPCCSRFSIWLAQLLGEFQPSSSLVLFADCYSCCACAASAFAVMLSHVVLWVMLMSIISTQVTVGDRTDYSRHLSHAVVIRRACIGTIKLFTD